MPRRELQGVVVSDKMAKTVTVSVQRRVLHPLYKKYVTTSKRFHAHDEQDVMKVGDLVRIAECRPISRSKRWEVIAKVGEKQLSKHEEADVSVTAKAKK